MAIASQYYYICSKCHFRTTLLSRIVEHLQVHNDTDTKRPSSFPYFDCFDHLKPLKCPSCDFSTEYLVPLGYHFVRNHDLQQFALKAKLKTCEKCGFCTHSNYLWIRHPIYGSCKSRKVKILRKRDGKWYPCEKCDFRTVHKDYLRKHFIHKHTPLKEIDWQYCKKCPAKFKTARNLQRHLKRGSHLVISLNRDGKWYLCQKCDYRTSYSGNLKRHITRKHTPLEEIEWQQCKKCPKKFKTPLALKKHQKNVHVSAVDHLHCSECDYSTPSRQTLGRHFNNKHTRPEEIKWVECYECGAKLKGEKSLKLHLVRHTTKEKQYKCVQCPFKTHRKDSLKRHIDNRHLKHVEVNWHKCQHCDYKSRRKYLITKHIQHVHSESQGLFQCGHCSFKFKTDKSLKYHILRNHESAFKCHLCNYRSKSEKTIELHKKNKHEKKHSKYKCSIKQHNLMKHTVDGEVFQCQQCDFKTPSKSYLSKHLKKHATRKCK